ncbi:SMP-30/gluconolactonase/LRE family protein [Sphingobium sp. 3R8]|uniref:SMP-30/gluconolactonase/LRE family protein n=1 Tax=Sphingobium sp. 3R8 TaxID=2874921 RepID=UPI001CC9000F|nr:SMP-30/gluconolactonase/LRE family protein [Sphingobium sp. 3R8]MBZ9649889.1 SMP-30/gluconolactonase/LRE family protein [Sphingobium sp. 3R8]
MDIQIVAEGLSFPEGPVWMKDGSIILVETGAGKLTRILPDGSKETVAECGGGPNGIAVGPDGMLYVCNNGGMITYQQHGLTLTTGECPEDYEGGWIDRIDPVSGKVERLYSSCDGQRLAGPNDIVFDYEGNIWFSDLGKYVGNATLNGGIFFAKPDGSFITRAVDRINVNGIGLSPDRKTVYGALSFESLLVGFDIVGEGKLEPIAGLGSGHVVAQFAARQLLDSLAVDEAGHICVATCLNGAGIGSVDPATGVVTNYPFPDVLTTNICFGGEDMQDAWVTMSTTGKLAKVRWPRAGLKLANYA